jgi:hypothetical protein
LIAETATTLSDDVEVYTCIDEATTEINYFRKIALSMASAFSLTA